MKDELKLHPAKLANFDCEWPSSVVTGEYFASPQLRMVQQREATSQAMVYKADRTDSASRLAVSPRCS